jgi:hypothetical protein
MTSHRAARVRALNDTVDHVDLPHEDAEHVGDGTLTHTCHACGPRAHRSTAAWLQAEDGDVLKRA